MSKPGLWDNPEAARKLVAAKQRCAAVVTPILKVDGLLEDGEFSGI